MCSHPCYSYSFIQDRFRQSHRKPLSDEPSLYSMCQQTTMLNLCSSITALKCISVLFILCVLFSGFDLPNWIPGLRNHRRPLHRSHAHRRALLSVLSLLRQLRREDVPEADVVHPLSQADALLGFVPHHNHHPVSVSEDTRSSVRLRRTNNTTILV